MDALMKPVWIIDDDRSIRWVLEKALTREDIEFKSFASADEAMHALTHGAPQMVISDIRMPSAVRTPTSPGQMGLMIDLFSWKR